MISKNFLDRKKIPFLSLDWLVMGFTNGIPAFGINDKLFPDEIAKKMWNFTKSICENIIWLGIDYIIEGEAMLPEHAYQLLLKYPDKVRICFVGYTDIDVNEKVNDIKAFSMGKSDWLSNEPDAYIRSHLSNMVTYSVMIRNECEKFNIKYFDTSNDFIRTIDTAFYYLIES